MMSYALGQSAGPGLAGLMVEILGAPMAVLTDAIGFFLCAGCLHRIDHREVPVAQHRRSVIRQISGGHYLSERSVCSFHVLPPVSPISCA